VDERHSMKLLCKQKLALFVVHWAVYLM